MMVWAKHTRAVPERLMVASPVLMYTHMLVVQGCSRKVQEEEENKKARKKRDKIKSALTRPLGPADPQHKGTELHLRMTYRECSEDQVDEQTALLLPLSTAAGLWL
jgi:hypothetical protein